MGHFFHEDEDDVDMDDYAMGQAMYMTGADGHVTIRRIITRRHVPLGKLEDEELPIG